MTYLPIVSVALLLLQVLTSQAIPHTLVIDSQEFLDSGQDRSSSLFPLSVVVYSVNKFRGNDDDNFYDSSEEMSSSQEEDDDTEELLDEPETLRRVRRRIIPVGKALDRDKVGSRNPYQRGRSPYAHAPSKSDSLVKQDNPTGSDALFTLFPDLAPSTWRQAHGFSDLPAKKKTVTKKSKHQERDTQATAPTKRKAPRNDRKPSKSYSKRKIKLVKDMKEDIATFANVHGVEKAASHFTVKFRTPIRVEAVEKYLRRYKNRQLRRGEKRQ